jgi:hypothetical protein
MTFDPELELDHLPFRWICLIFVLIYWCSGCSGHHQKDGYSMTTETFPMYDSREQSIECFHCGKSVHCKSELTGYPAGGGEFRQRCGSCLFWSFYDVSGQEVICPGCGIVNELAHDDGAVDGPREYHAKCWIDSREQSID